MHLSDGVVTLPILAVSTAVAAGLCAWSAYRIRDEEIPRLAVFTAAFYVASLVHFPLPGGTSVHLILNGLMGVVLGRRAFLAIPVGLFMQFALLGPGGISVLGVNACIFGIPALIVGKMYEVLCRRGERWCVPVAGICGALGVVLSGALFSAILWFSDENLMQVAWFALILHLPIALVEGMATAFTVGFLRKVQPSLVQGKVL